MSIENKTLDVSAELQKLNDTLVTRINDLEAKDKAREEAIKAEAEKAAKVKVDTLKEGKGENKTDPKAEVDEQIQNFLREAMGGRTDAGRRFMEAVSAGSATPEIWAQDIARLRDESPFAVMRQAVRIVPDARRQGSKIYFPTVAPIAMGALQVGVAPGEATVTVSNVEAIINERGAMVYITKSTEEDAIPSLRNVIEDRLATAAALDWDDIVLGWAENANSVGAAQIGGTVVDAGKMAATLISKAIGTLLAGTYPPWGGYLVIDGAQYAQLSQDSAFTNAATRGSDRDARISNYQGINVVVSPCVDRLKDADDGENLGTHRAFLFAPDAIYVADKRDVTLETDYDPTTRRTVLVLSQRFGGSIVHPKGVVEITTIGVE